MPSSFPGGIQVATYLPARLVRSLDEQARAVGLSRAAWVRTKIVAALAAVDHDSAES